MKHSLSLLVLFSISLLVGCGDDTPNNNTNPPPAPTPPFYRMIKGTAHDESSKIIQTTGDGFAIVGYTGSYGSGGDDVYVIKLSSSGALEWLRTIGGSSGERGNSIIQTLDGGYAISGYTFTYGAGQRDIYVIKLDASGNIMWTRTVGGTDYDEGEDIIQTTDSGYVISGTTRSYGAGLSDVYIVKLDADGSLVWTRTVGGPNEELGLAITSSSDGGYAIGGRTNSYGTGPNFYFVKLNGSGTFEWARSIGGSADETCRSLLQTSDGSYVLAGVSNMASFRAYIVKLTSAGALTWTRIIDGTSYFTGQSLIQTSDGGFVLSGATDSKGAIAKLNTNAELVWINTIDTMDICNSIVQLPDGSYAAAGDGIGNGTMLDIHVVKLDNNGTTCYSTFPAGGTNSTGGSIVSGGISGTGGITGIGGTSGTGGTFIIACD